LRFSLHVNAFFEQSYRAKAARVVAVFMRVVRVSLLDVKVESIAMRDCDRPSQYIVSTCDNPRDTRDTAA
jgi:hypothetical protein